MVGAIFQSDVFIRRNPRQNRQFNSGNNLDQSGLGLGLLPVATRRGGGGHHYGPRVPG